MMQNRSFEWKRETNPFWLMSAVFLNLNPVQKVVDFVRLCCRVLLLGQLLSPAKQPVPQPERQKPSKRPNYIKGTHCLMKSEADNDKPLLTLFANYCRLDNNSPAEIYLPRHVCGHLVPIESRLAASSKLITDGSMLCRNITCYV